MKDEKEYQRLWYQKNKEKRAEQYKKYIKTPRGRAAYLISSYNAYDKKYGRGRGDLTSEWVVENIFTKPCAHCGKTGWNIMGCNRLDNSKPHTKDNVEPCCFECNCKEWGKDSACKNNMRKVAENNSKKVFQYSLDGELIGEWKSAKEVQNVLGFPQSNISDCCLGKRQTCKGYRWSFEPL